MTPVHARSTHLAPSVEAARQVSTVPHSSSGGEPTSLLPPAIMSDSQTMLAMLQLESLSLASKASEKSREAYEAAEEATDRARIDTMRDKANETFVFGILGGLATATQGTLGVIGATKDTSSKAGEQSRDMFKAGATFAEGTARALNTFKEVNATNEDANIAELEGAAKGQRRAAEQLGRMIDRSHQSEAKVRELLGEILKAKDACERSAILRSA
ncbi:MAG: hypothetical protein U0174_27910 [Polyangiaceae bacterium]